MSNFDITDNPFLQSVSTTANREPVSQEDDLGQDAFLRLMIAQLENQDPLSPAENGEFIAQLAQFSSLEGITNLNTTVSGLADDLRASNTDLISQFDKLGANEGVADLGTTLEGLASEFRSSRALEASAMVGRGVDVASSTSRLYEDGAIWGTLELPEDASDIQIAIESAEGQTVHFERITGPVSGDLGFSWDGVNDNGSTSPAGVYNISAVATVNGQQVGVDTRVFANVNSVSIGANNTVSLNVDGVGEVSVDDVRGIL